MSRPVTVSEAQDQLLETALELYRMIQRLHRCHEVVRVPFELAHEYYEAEGRGNVPPTIELAVAEEINVTIDELQGIADRLQKASRATEASIREEWRQDRKVQAP